MDGNSRRETDQAQRRESLDRKDEDAVLGGTDEGGWDAGNGFTLSQKTKLEDGTTAEARWTSLMENKPGVARQIVTWELERETWGLVI